MSDSTAALLLSVIHKEIVPGSTIQGEVYVTVTEMTPGECVEVTFKGRLKTKWTIVEGVRDILTGINDSEAYNYTGKRSFFTLHSRIHCFDSGIMPPGQYRFPFQVKCPFGFPGSFRYIVSNSEDEVEYAEGVVVYRLVGRISASRVRKTAVVLTVGERNSEEITRITGEVVVNVATWGCISKGKVGISIDIDKNRYSPGETAEVTVTVNTQSTKMSAIGVSVRLVRVVRLRDDTGQQQIVTAVLSENHIREAIASYESRIISLSIPSDEVTLQAGTVSSELLDCEYFLCAEGVLSGKCTCCEPPKICKPVTIQSLLRTESISPAFLS